MTGQDLTAYGEHLLFNDKGEGYAKDDVSLCAEIKNEFKKEITLGEAMQVRRRWNELKALVKPTDPDQPMFLRLPVKCRDIVLEALRSAGFLSEAKQMKEFTADYVSPAADAVRRWWLDQADQKDGEFECDSDTTISHSDDNGQYVLGWVWVDGPELEDDDTDEEEDDGE